MTTPTLWYFADPMCSWCWGFTPVIETIREEYRDRMRIALMLGGLRPGTTEPMTPEQRAEILHHWRAVAERTGQNFAFEDALPEGFVYDTEPPSRAVLAAASLKPELSFAMFKLIQAAFYSAGQDVTQPAILARLAGGLGLDAAAFLTAFNSDAVRERTQAHFEMARRLGIRGFPTLVLQEAGGYHLLASGYQPVEELRAEIEARLG